MAIMLVTWCTFGSRYSNKISRLNLINATARLLSQNEVILLKDILQSIFILKSYEVFEFTVLEDHVHMIIKCNYKLLSQIMQCIKGISAFRLNQLTTNGNNEYRHLWAAKYHKRILSSELEVLRAMNYVRNNVEIHKNRLTQTSVLGTNRVV